MLPAFPIVNRRWVNWAVIYGDRKFEDKRICQLEDTFRIFLRSDWNKPRDTSQRTAHTPIKIRTGFLQAETKADVTYPSSSDTGDGSSPFASILDVMQRKHWRASIYSKHSNPRQTQHALHTVFNTKPSSCKSYQHSNWTMPIVRKSKY
jgi:hypothetical protein